MQFANWLKPYPQPVDARTLVSIRFRMQIFFFFAGLTLCLGLWRVVDPKAPLPLALAIPMTL